MFFHIRHHVWLHCLQGLPQQLTLAREYATTVVLTITVVIITDTNVRLQPCFAAAYECVQGGNQGMRADFAITSDIRIVIIADAKMCSTSQSFSQAGCQGSPLQNKGPCSG